MTERIPCCYHNWTALWVGLNYTHWPRGLIRCPMPVKFRLRLITSRRFRWYRLAVLRIYGSSFRENRSFRPIPTRQRKPEKQTRNTPNPYTTEREKLIELASAKYLVGTDISPSRKPPRIISARISLSKTKSLEQSGQRVCVSRSLENARNPVWYSESLAPSMIF